MKVERSRRWSLLGAALLGVLISLSFALVSCGEDGVTPDCPPLPLYNIRDDAWQSDADIQEARAEAIEAKCLTDLGDAQPAD
jgi:hypothetical protein